MKATLVITTTNSIEEAESLAESIIRKKLAACVNVLPGVSSFYTWENQPQKSREYLLFIKTDEELYEALESYIKANHSYEVPACVALPLDKVEENYLKWIKESLRS